MTKANTGLPKSRRTPRKKPEPKYPNLVAGLERLHDEGYNLTGPDSASGPVTTPIYHAVLTEFLEATK